MLCYGMKHDFYSVPQAGEILGITRQGAWKAIKQGRLKAIFVGNWIITKKDLKKFAKENGYIFQ